MIDLGQLRKYVIQDSLKPINLYSEDSEELLISTAAVETMCGKYLRQKGNGPAFGIYEMETPTFLDTWAYTKKSKFIDPIMELCNFRNDPHAEEMITNLKFATIMARMHYYRFPEPIPDKNNTLEIWRLYKKRWNTSLGATTENEFIAAYEATKSKITA